jgi:glutathione peroxidase
MLLVVLALAVMVVQEPAAGRAPQSLHDFTVNTIDLKPQSLAAYKGKVVLVVNTASRCTHTPQYAGLEKLYLTYKDKGFVILGFPSNDFFWQEPGSEAEIKQFCSLKYHVTFPMFAKVEVKGSGQAPLYRFLSAKFGRPKWNFHKYLVGKDGQVIRAFAPGVQPDDNELRTALEAALRG